MLAFTPIPTRPNFASVSSSTVFGPAAVFLAPRLRLTGRPSLSTTTAAAHFESGLQQQQAEDGFELLGSVDDDDAATSDAASDVTLVAAGQNEKVVECKGQEVETAAPVPHTTTTATDDATARLLPHLNASHIHHLQARRRDADIHASWLENTGLDVNKTGVNGPRPRCTVEELRDGMDALFGGPRRVGGEREGKRSKSGEEKRKAKLVKKVRGLGWMA